MITVSPFGDELKGKWGTFVLYCFIRAADSTIIHHSLFTIHFLFMHSRV